MLTRFRSVLSAARPSYRVVTVLLLAAAVFSFVSWQLTLVFVGACAGWVLLKRWVTWSWQPLARTPTAYQRLTVLVGTAISSTIPTFYLIADGVLNRPEEANSVLIAVAICAAVDALVVPRCAVSLFRVRHPSVASEFEALPALEVALASLIGGSMLLAISLPIFGLYPARDLWIITAIAAGAVLAAVALPLAALKAWIGVIARSRSLQAVLLSATLVCTCIAIGVGVEVYLQNSEGGGVAGGLPPGYTLEITPSQSSADEFSASAVAYVNDVNGKKFATTLAGEHVQAASGPGWGTLTVSIPGPQLYESRTVTAPSGREIRLTLCNLGACPVAVRIDNMPTGSVWEIRNGSIDTREPFGATENVLATATTYDNGGDRDVVFSYLRTPLNVPVLAPLVEQFATWSTFEDLAVIVLVGLIVRFGWPIFRWTSARAISSVAHHGRRRSQRANSNLPRPSVVEADAGGERTAKASGRASTVDDSAVLRALRRLHEDGDISDEEYDLKKQEVLDRM